MPKLSRKSISTEDLGNYINNLWSAFTLMGSKEDIRLLFKDLFTPTEYRMFAKRLEIACRLLNKEAYTIIKRDLSVTDPTIAHVSNILTEKGEGYRKAHKKIEILKQKHLDKEKEYRKNLENPFRKNNRQKTLLGTVLKAGVQEVDKVISKKLKERTAHETLPL